MTFLVKSEIFLFRIFPKNLKNGGYYGFFFTNFWN